MGKDQDLIQVVKDRDIGALQKILVKMKPGKQGKTKLLGSTKRGNINFQDADGMSALHQAALMGNLDMMQLLLEHGAQVNIQDNKGMLALHYAAWQGKSEPVHVLLQWKAPVNMQAQEQITPLHLACQHGHFDVVNLLLLHHANPTLYNKDFKTALDLACEFGHYRVVDLLLRSNLCAPLLVDSPSDMIDNNRTTCLHLAAKNGHVEIIRLLLQAGVNINRCTLRGTSLHEAALCGKLDVVKLLIDRGIDVNKANSYDQTALDIVTTYTATKGARELKHILKEASFAVKARAIKDYNNTYDSEALTFKEGDIIKVLERKEDVWKGIVVSDTRRMSKPGYFPADHVILLDNADYHSHHHPHQPSNQNQKLAYHQDHHTHQHTNSHLPPPHPNHQHHHLHQHQHPQQHYGHYHSHNGALHLTGQQQQHHSSPTPYPLYNSVQDVQNVNGHQYISHVGDHIIHHHNNSHHGDWSNLSPYSGVSDIRSNGSTKDSPTNSNRNSAASSDSGRGYSTTGHLEPKVQHNYANVQITNQHRLSGQSYESGVSSRQSYHSTSSSSVGSLDRLEESGYSSQVNVAELFQAGLPDHEVIRCWLRDLRFEDYHGNFIQAGYDMPTISRMTPEDLTAIGITKPGHRKKLKAEIARLNIHDGIPEHKPGSVVEWLHLLNLNQYSTTLTKQGYDTIDSLTDITWEDLEEIGIQKLGHQKKIMLAIERLKRLNSGAKRMSTMDSSKRSSGEALEPPISNNNSRWSGSSGGGGQMMSSSYNGQDVAGGIPYKSRHASAEIINNNMSGIEYMMGSPVRNRLSSDGNMDLSYPPPSPGYQPDLVPIQVKRSSSGSGKYSKETKDMAGQTITYQSFQVPPGGHRISDPMDRESTPTGDMYQMSSSPVPVAPVAPKAVIKPQPVATIVAKTRRSSREYSPDIIDIEKHEFEKNQDNILRSPTHNSFMKPKSEVIYDTPRLNSPLSPIQRSHDFCTPVKTVVSVHHSNPSEPLFIATHASSQHQEVCYPSPPQGSPSSRSKKVPPPPPPKRTNSISQKSDLGLCSPKPQHTPIALVKAGVQTPQSVRREDNNTAPQQQAFAACVQSLSEKLGKKRHESVNDCDTGSSDSEDLPPPPPPLAMDIITPKLHNYGIPTKEEKSSMGSEYRMQSVAKHHEQQQQQLQQAKHFEQHSVQNQIHQHAMSPSRGIPQHQHHPQLPHSPHHNAMGSFSVGQSPAVLSGQATGAHYQRQNSNNHLKEQQNSAPNTPKKQVQSVEPSLHHQTRVSNKGSVQSPSHSFKAQHEVKGKAASPPGGEDKMTVENTFGVKLRSSAQIQNTSVSVTASVVPSAPPQVAPKSSAATSVSSGAPKQVFHTVKTAQQASETAAITTNVPKTKNSEVSQPLNSFQKPPNAAVDGARGKRKDSSSSLDLNTSTTSIDSNTLPFANENVGTIKQRTPTSKPSIALGSDDAHAAEKANLSAHLYSQGHDGSTASCVAKTQTVSSGSRPVACAQESKPTVPKKPSTKNKSGKNEDVLSDIDNMLQGLTNELDAMLEEEEMLALNKS